MTVTLTLSTEQAEFLHKQIQMWFDTDIGGDDEYLPHYLKRLRDIAAQLGGTRYMDPGLVECARQYFNWQTKDCADPILDYLRGLRDIVEGVGGDTTEMDAEIEAEEKRGD